MKLKRVSKELVHEYTQLNNLERELTFFEELTIKYIKQLDALLIKKENCSEELKAHLSKEVFHINYLLKEIKDC